MKRHTITLGASTSAGGKVIAASSHGSIGGVAIALEGDAIYCPACKSQGKISCIGPRIPETWNGKNVALENDLCVCGCSDPPRLLKSQSVRYQFTDDTGPAASQSPAANTDTTTSFDDRYVLIDAETGQPLAFTEYALKRANGQFEFGTMDDKGRTHLLAAQASSESVEIYA